MKGIFLSVIILTLMVGCNGQRKDADAVMKEQTEKMVSEASRRVGLPDITNYTEKRFVKMLYELRDKEVTTYSYYLDMHGKRHFLCKSIGFGIPASVQYVNPQVFKRVDMGQYTGEATLPQAEPNGLFMPDSLSATYVMCINPKTKKIAPVYFEPQLIVSPFKLRAQ